MKDQFAKVLGCKEQFINARLVALGHKNICTRCGGGGQYSYCQMYGTTCFQCKGAGYTAVKLTAKLLKTVEAQVANGELAPYLADVAKRSAAKKWWDRLMAAWGTNPANQEYKIRGDSWMKHHDECPEAPKVDKICAPMCDRIEKLTPDDSAEAEALIARAATAELEVIRREYYSTRATISEKILAALDTEAVPV